MVDWLARGLWTHLVSSCFKTHGKFWLPTSCSKQPLSRKLWTSRLQSSTPLYVHDEMPYICKMQPYAYAQVSTHPRIETYTHRNIQTYIYIYIHVCMYIFKSMHIDNVQDAAPRMPWASTSRNEGTTCPSEWLWSEMPIIGYSIEANESVLYIES